MADVPFEHLCKVLEELFSKKKSKPDQERILSQFINEIKLMQKADGKKGGNIFPVLRLLLPDLDRERSAYNLKTTKLIPLLTKVLSLPKSSPNAQMLQNFKTVKNSKEGSDFASVAFFVLNSRMGQPCRKLTVGEVNECLDKIAGAEVGNKGPILDEVFTYVLKSTTAKEAKWFLRIVLKDLKLSMGKTKILSAIHPDAPEYFEQCSRLLKVCEEFDDSNTRPLEMGIELFTAVSPMLSERLDIKRIEKLWQNKTYQIEPKFDGERFQIHMKDGIFEYFSRKGFSYSEKYGKTYSDGLLTPLLKNCFMAEVNSFVLDGEMMGWHKTYDCFGSKGMSFDIKKITEYSKYRPCFCAFDILYYNGKTLVGYPEKGGIPLKERLRILDGIFTDKPGVIQHSPRKEVQDSSEVLRALHLAMDNQEEGIVLKDVQSYYIANRRNAGWYKIKPEYTEGTMDDLDLVIIGADYAENKKQGLAKSFFVACANNPHSGDSPHRWMAVGRVATGLSFEQREQLCRMLEVHWKPSQQAPPPSCLVFNREKPDLWILPEHSVVLTVRATELIRSTDFGTDYTLRFPRILSVREDKPVADIMTLEEFNRLVADKGPVVKLSTKHINPEDVTVSLRPRRKRTATTLKVAEQFQTKDEDIQATSMALAGRKICILSDDEDCSKAELESIVKSHGGIVVQNYSDSTWCCIVGRLNFRARSAIEQRAADAAPTDWLRSVRPGPSVPLPPPSQMLALTPATALRLARHYDLYGNSYTEPADEQTLKTCFDKMDRDNEPEVHLTTQEMLDLDKELFGDNNPFSFLRRCFIHLRDTSSLIAIKARMFKATLCDIDSRNLTHVVVDEEEKDEIENVNTVDRALIVSKDWLEACFAEKKMVSEIPYILN